jgi:hypothetical protein
MFRTCQHHYVYNNIPVIKKQSCNINLVIISGLHHISLETDTENIKKESAFLQNCQGYSSIHSMLHSFSLSGAETN